ITLSKSGLSFSQTAINSLGRPEFVKLMVDKDDKLIAVQVVGQDDEDATPFFKKGRKNLVVRWNYVTLTTLLEELMGWDVSTQTYKIRGQTISKDDALLFDLNKADLVNRR